MSKSNHSFELKVQTVVDEVISKIPNFPLETEKVDLIGGITEVAGKKVAPEEYVWDRLQRLGVEKGNVESYSIIDDGYCREGDARSVFCELMQPTMPIPWFRKMWSILCPATSYYDSTDTNIAVDTDKAAGITQTLSDFVKSNRPISQWKDIELIEAYTLDALPEIIDELAKRSQNKAVMVYNRDKTLNKELSLKFLRDSRRKKVPETYAKNGRAYILKKVGDFPEDIQEESPIIPGNILVDGYCDVSELDYSDVPMASRQFLRLIVQHNDHGGSRMELVKLVKMAEKGVEELSNIFPSVANEFERLKETGNLPSLKVLNSNNEANGKSDPFGNGNKRF
jgi:hypothetical protein